MSETTAVNLGIFMGILNAVAEKNGAPIPLHLESLFANSQTQTPDNLEEAIQSSGQTLENNQCACLFANLVNLSIKDGRVNDRSFISDARDRLRLDRSDARDVEEAIEARFQADSVFRSDEEWSAFCAGLIAMAESDNVTDAFEEVYLKKFVPDPSHIEAGRALFKDGDEISAKLARFSGRQKRCLAAHGISIMLIDGDWKGTEQEALEKLNDQMHLSRFDAEKMMKGIHGLYHVAVFA